MNTSWLRWTGLFLMLGMVVTLTTGGCLDFGGDKKDPTTTPTTGSSTGYSISGVIVLSTGGFASGVTIGLTGAANQTATTNDSGNYTFVNLPGGFYTLTPSKSGYSFNPISENVPINNSNVTGKNFTATASTGGGGGVQEHFLQRPHSGKLGLASAATTYVGGAV